MNPQDAWSAAFHQLELQLDRASFDTWVRGARLIAAEGDVFVIGVRNSYARDMLQHRLYRNVRRVLSDVYGQPVELRFEINKAEPAAPQPVSDQEMPLFRLLAQQEMDAPKEAQPLHQVVARPQRPSLPESELNPRFTFERFLAGGENAMIYAAARAVAERPASVYNPFFIYGGVGLGKTHLMQAIAHALQTRGLRVIYIPSEAFTNDLVDSIRQRSTAMFRDKYRSVDVLLVDDIQFIGGKESTQEEFFHTFNALYTYNKQIVLVSDRHPQELQTLEARLRSRFEGGLVMDIQPPGFETRLAILKQWAAERALTVSRSVMEMVAEKAKGSVRELEGVFNQMVATMQLSGESMTKALAEDILDGYHRPRYHLTLSRVIETAARHHGLKPEDLTGPRRTAAISQARQIAMYLARELTNCSLPQIGEAFGGRKHSTVLHSCKNIEAGAQRDPLIQAMVADLRAKLLNGRE